MIKTSKEPVTLTQMVAKVLKMEPYFSFRDYYSYYWEIKEEAENTQKILQSGKLMRVIANRRPKCRQIMAHRYLESESFSVGRFIDTMMSDSSDVSYRFIRAEEMIYKMANLSRIEMLKNPLATLNNSSDPNHNNEVIRAARMYEKHHVYQKVSSILDVPTTMNRENDILNVYCWRSNSVFALVSEGTSNSEDFKTFMNSMTFCRNPEDLVFPEEKDIKPGDSIELAAVKMAKQTIDSGQVAMESLDFMIAHPVFKRTYENGLETLIWLRGNSMAKLIVDRPYVRLIVYGRVKATIMTPVIRELFKLMNKEVALRIRMKRKLADGQEDAEMSVSEFLHTGPMRRISAEEMPVITAIIERSMHKWRVCICTPNYKMAYINRKYGYFKDSSSPPPPLMTRFLSMTSTNSSIREINDFMNELGMQATTRIVDMTVRYEIDLDDTVSSLVSFLANVEADSLFSGFSERLDDDPFPVEMVPEELLSILEEQDSGVETTEESRVMDRLDFEQDIDMALIRSINRELDLDVSLTIKLSFQTAAGLIVSYLPKVLDIEDLNSAIKIRIASILLRNVMVMDERKCSIIVRNVEELEAMNVTSIVKSKTQLLSQVSMLEDLFK